MEHQSKESIIEIMSEEPGKKKKKKKKQSYLSDFDNNA